MSKIDELIRKYCPNGVEYKTIEELGDLYGGLTGKSKDDFNDGNARYITYMNVFSNIAADTSRNDFVKIKSDERQRKLEKGDVLFTGSSENPDECGMSSVVVEEPTEPLYLNSFCFIFRLNNTDIFMPDFLKYLFRDTGIRKQIAKTASGVTRFNVSKKRFSKVVIPIPPLEVQKEIVNVLDKFTQLEAELSAELSARQIQYEYYRSHLLGFDSTDISRSNLGDMTMYSKSRIASDDLDHENYVGVDNLLQNKKGKEDSSHVPSVGNMTRYERGDVLIGNIRPYLKKIWYADKVGGTNGDVLVIHIKDEYKDKLRSRYLYHLLASDKFFTFNMQNSKGAKMPRGNKDSIMKFQISVPPIEEQERVVSILDKFDKLVNGISEGLPAEINARHQQYEYYRTKLLTFQELLV